MKWLEYDGNDETKWPVKNGEYVIWLKYGYWSTAIWDGDGFYDDYLGDMIDEQISHYIIITPPTEAIDKED